MIKNLLFCAIFIFAGWMAGAQPTFTNVSIVNDSCTNSMFGGNGYSVIYMAQFNNAVSGNTATVFWGDGTSTSANVWSQGSTGSINASHHYNTPGVYTVKAILYDALANATDSSVFNMDAFCSTIYGVTYKQMDANCTYDAGIDQVITAALEIEVQKNGLPIDTFTTYGSYIYSVPNPDMVSEFSFHPLTTGTYYNQVCPVAPYKVRLDTLYSSSSYGFNFGYTCNASATGFDLFAYANASLRPVNFSNIKIYASNSACTPVNGTLTAHISPKFSYASASVSPTTISGNTLTWNLSNLSSTTAPDITVYLNPVGTLSLGDTAISIVSITPTTGDVNMANNTYTSVDTIRASFDPNDKKVLPSGDITAGQLLTYTINFENLGNDTAFNIHIIDTLSANLDISSFKLLHSSHSVSVNHLKAGNTAIARFDFKDIRLADKSHPETNKGYVMYSVKAKTSLNPGDEVKNTAHIFFDINPAVVTNTTVSKIPVINTVPDVADAKTLSMYPNPSDDLLFIDNSHAEYSRVHIANALGQKLGEYQLTPNVNRIDISQLPAGLYYLSAFGAKEIVSQTFVVK